LSQIHNTFEGTLASIVTEAELASLDGKGPIGVRALWDTGATGSMVSKSVVEKLGLVPIDETIVSGVTGEAKVSIYAVCVLLPNGEPIDISVMECRDMPGFDLLVGMDIITMGDFAVSCKDSVTEF
jgi:predicted aspartyl protease